MTTTTLKSRHFSVPAIVVLVVGVFHATAEAEDHAAMRRQIQALSELTTAPAFQPADGFSEEGGLRALYYDGLPWQGKPTRVFAWLGLPQREAGRKLDDKVPGVVLVHGGGGTAFKEWVGKWNAKGFAALSIAVEGQTDLPAPAGRGWMRHEWGGPARDGIYGDSAEPLIDQWMYHAVADTVLANSLLRSLPEVDAQQVGVMGISWGGIITSTVIGIDGRFAFAIPTYGCGSLADAQNQYGRALGSNAVYREVWDPMVRMKNVTMPTLWLSWTGDEHFPLDSLRNSYAAAPAPHMVALLPEMKHSHAAGWNPPDSYAFASGIVQTGAPWCRYVDSNAGGEVLKLKFVSTKSINEATLVFTSDIGFTGHRHWNNAAAEFTQTNDQVIVTATLPAGATAWFVNIRSGELIASSDLQEPASR